MLWPAVPLRGESSEKSFRGGLQTGSVYRNLYIIVNREEREEQRNRSKICRGKYWTWREVGRLGVREERGRCRGTIGIFFSGETETKIEAAGRLRLKYIVAQYWGGEARDRLLDHQWAKAQSIYGKRSAKARRGVEKGPANKKTQENETSGEHADCSV